jgi:hypothetical protein
MKVNNYPLKTPVAGDKLFGSDSNGDQKQFDMSAVSNNVFQYEIGQYVADEGGVIAHRWLSTTAGGYPETGSFENYLVVDTTDLSLSASWATSNVNISSSQSTFNGLTNTSNLITAGSGSGITAGTAAVLCNSSTNNGKTDWYLPAIDELNVIFNNRWAISQALSVVSGATNFGFDRYWSSTQSGSTTAWYLSFNSSSIASDTKGNAFFVRAIRKFSI